MVIHTWSIGWSACNCHWLLVNGLWALLIAHNGYPSPISPIKPFLCIFLNMETYLDLRSHPQHPNWVFHAHTSTTVISFTKIMLMPNFHLMSSLMAGSSGMGIVWTELNWKFWLKILGNSRNFKTETEPTWSYFDAVDNGWLPKGNIGCFDLIILGWSWCVLENRYYHIECWFLPVYVIVPTTQIRFLLFSALTTMCLSSQ